MCIHFLSMWRLSRQDFDEVVGNSEKRNRRPALNVFYGLVFVEVLLFLVEISYLQWKLKVQKHLVQVKDEFRFDDKLEGVLRRFFYDTYSLSINDSIFDNLKINLVCFSIDLPFFLFWFHHHFPLPSRMIIQVL